MHLGSSPHYFYERVLANGQIGRFKPYDIFPVFGKQHDVWQAIHLSNESSNTSFRLSPEYEWTFNILF